MFFNGRGRLRKRPRSIALGNSSVRTLAGCIVIGRGPSSRMAILYFLADEPVQEAEIAMTEKFGEGFALKPTTEQAASKYLEADPGVTHGALNLVTDVPLFYHLVRIV